MAKKHVKKILSDLGDKITDEIGVPERTIRHARQAGYFSGLWYGPIKSACDEVGAECSLKAFNWKASAKKIGNAGRVIQDPDTIAVTKAAS